MSMSQRSMRLGLFGDFFFSLGCFVVVVPIWADFRHFEGFEG